MIARHNDFTNTHTHTHHPLNKHMNGREEQGEDYTHSFKEEKLDGMKEKKNEIF